eukprot:11445309-Alexandrium_andersonii.AAC.1
MLLACKKPGQAPAGAREALADLVRPASEGQFKEATNPDGPTPSATKCVGSSKFHRPGRML